MTARATFIVGGVVQGVGFRPFVHHLATEMSLDGWVANNADGVAIDVQGSAGDVEVFARRLLADAPPLAMIDSCRRAIEAVDGRRPGFAIRPSSGGAMAASVLVPPDTAVCQDCVEEMFDPADRRYGHPFITCTNCGPRFTIMQSLPYDRPATTMASFDLCAACRAEYDDPSNRRHHAQPIGCHDCGPRLWFKDASTWVAGTERNSSALIDWTVACLHDGCVVAMKGLGGYHLVCDARSERAVQRLRSRKHRPDKPLAVMVGSVAAARKLACISELEAEVLSGPSRPIVLLRARPGSVLASAVAPDNPFIGIMLAYAPVHHLLFAEPGVGPLVMTSGNVAGEPIVYRDDDALERLAPIADAFLGHDRPIHVPCDDSVMRVLDGRALPLRRSRGAAPIPVTLEIDGPPMLAVGGELKNAFAVSKPTGDGRTRVWLSQHIGDMGSLATLDAFEAGVAQFCSMYGVVPRTVLADAHPGYQSSRWAHRVHPQRVAVVQHHEAHVASVLAEHHVEPSTPVIGFAFDGTGYGTDATMWGGEIFAGPLTDLRRVAHLAPVPLPGGDAAIWHPSKVALAHLFAAGLAWDPSLAPVRATRQAELGLLRRQLERSVACVPTTSMGRLFDAIAALVGLRQSITFEAQAAIDLEIAAVEGIPGRCMYRLDLVGHGTSAVSLEPRNLFRQMVSDIEAGLSVADIARGFHDAIVVAMVEVAQGIRVERAIDVVALSGGVFQNALLVTLCRAALEAEGFTVLTHRLVPPNDGGLALGQIYLALATSVVPQFNQLQEV